jgi:uncharacterized protein YgbK (DUF1537 family)
MSESYSPRVAVIADDLTGAGDIGVKFSDKGLQTVISADISRIENVPENAEVWVINTQSRGDTPSKASKKTAKAARMLLEWKADYYYKKIDSTLRGNICSELESFIEVLDPPELFFCASYPSLGRTTIDDEHYIYGKKVSESEFSHDPESPVKESNIRRLLEKGMRDISKIRIIQASSDYDLEIFASSTEARYFAGASAMAEKLIDNWMISNRQEETLIISPGPVLTITGSRSPVSRLQVEYLQKSGCRFYSDTADIGEFAGDLCISTPEEETANAMKNLRGLISRIEQDRQYSRVLLNGGETAFVYCQETGISELAVHRSVMPGIALVSSPSDEKLLILKPGSYGDPDTLMKAAGILGAKQ